MYSDIDNVALRKSYDFALKIVRLSQFLQKDQKEFIISKQIGRSGTSIGANLEEAVGGQSKKDFYAKLCISYKEARETLYWLRIIRDVGLLEKQRIEIFISDCEELLRILGKSKSTFQKNIS